MNLRIGFELGFSCSQPIPMLLMLNTHSSHVNDVIEPDRLQIDPPISLTQYHDSFGNLCSRLVTPSSGFLTLSTEALLNVPDRPEEPAAENYQMSACNFCSEAGIVKPTCCRIRHGHCLAARPKAGLACRRFATMCTSILPSTTSKPGRQEQLMRPTRRESVCAGTTHTWQSRCVAR